MEELKKKIRAVLQTFKYGIQASCFEDHYRNLAKENIQYEQYGFHSLDDLMSHIPDTVDQVYARGIKMYQGISNEYTDHLQHLIDRQRSARKSKPIPSRRRPMCANENLQNSNFRHNSFRHEDNRKRYPNVRVTVDGSGRGQQVNYRGDVKRSVEMGDINANCNKHEPKSGLMPLSNTLRVFEKAVKDISSNEQVSYGSVNSFPLAPRFQKQKNTTPAPEFVKGRHEHLPRSNKVPDGKKYEECLVEVVAKHSLPIAFQTLPVENGYICSIQIQNEVYKSSAFFTSEQEALYSAAKKACNELGLDPYKMDDPVGVDEHELKKRVQQIVVHNGLWLNKLGEAYEKKFCEVAPDNLQDLVRSWVDMFKIEQASATQMEIIYPVKPSLVMFTGKEVKIENAELLPVGSVVNVYVSFIYSAAEFYVHYESSCIQEIDTELTIHCRKCHVDIKTLQINGFCVAQYSDDAWYRASILDINEEKREVEVYYVDYGNKERVSIDRITKLPASAAHYPAQAVHCALYQLIPPQDETAFEISKQKFGEFGQYQLQAKAVLIDSNSVCQVILIDPKSPSNVSINDILVSQKLAQMPEADTEEDEPAPLMLPSERFWDVYVCCLSSTTDVIIRIVGENYSDELEKLEKEIENRFAKLPTGQIRKGDICAAEVEGCFHRVKVLQMKERRRTEKLEKEIEKWFPEQPNGQIREGDVCAAEIEGSYHRVKVLQMKENRKNVECLFIDRGDSACLTLDQLRIFDSNLNYLPFQVECLFLDHGDSDNLLLDQLRLLDPNLNYLPYQAIPCVLAGLEQYSCNIVAIDKLIKVALGKTCVAETATKDNKIYAVLYDTVGEDDININKTVMEYAASEGTDLLSIFAHDGSESVSSVTLSELSLKSTTSLETVMKQSGSKDSVTSPTASNSSSNTSPVSGYTPDSPASFSLQNATSSSNSTSSVCSGIIASSSGSPTPPRSSDKISVKTLEAPAASAASAVASANTNDFLSPTSSIISSCGSESSNTDAVWSRADYEKLKPPGQFKMDPLPNVTFVYVEYINSPSNFNIIPFDFLNDRDDFTNRLTEKMNTISMPVKLTQDDILLSHPYAASIDDIWYRVVPTSPCDATSYLVWYADYGGYNLEYTGNLQPLPEEFWALPYQSITCKLHNFIPVKRETWSEAAKYKFFELVSDKCFACIAKEMPAPTATELGSGAASWTDSVVPVILIDTCGSDDVCIDEILLSLGYGKYEISS